MIRLDAPTLLIATTLVAAMAGSLFLLSWSQDRGTRALLVWGVAHLVGAVASVLLALRGVLPGWLSIGLGNTLMIGAYGAIWSGLRAFEGRSPRLWPGLASGAAWALACLVPAFYESLTARVILASLLASLFCALGARELWRGRADGLVSRYPAIALLGTYAVVYLARVPLVIAAPPAPGTNPLQGPWIAPVCLMSMMLMVAIAFTFMALTKERAEREQRIAAGTDALTGAANRRAFVAGTKARLAEPALPVVILLFDLDHFKHVNDEHGHEVGDGVLVGFCCLLREILPPGTLVGRLGGEEFACTLAGTSPARGLILAGRVRAAVERLAVPAFPDLRIGVSAGLAASDSRGRDFDLLMRRADAALYRAKRNGRNRVETSERGRDRLAGSAA
ncbi:diguanylate cyclase [Methylobacterium sp. sgz302541]|uniref:GGDEF domain-containing protein n=1 Tax=unclassified Methylobacterium TaxID=2615210 RepID=UPI003D33E58C